MICQVKGQPNVLIGLAASVSVYKDSNRHGIKRPGIFTNIASFKNWIVAQINEFDGKNRSNDCSSISINFFVNFAIFILNMVTINNYPS